MINHQLGAVSLSPDILTKANIGLWAFELDEGQPPRMYVDDTMLGLVGLEHQVSPEETYHAWYDHIAKDSYGLVNDAVAKMMAGEHAEVQYPWHHPDGHTMIVRCGGIRNSGYTKGIRIEGTHQDVTVVLHFDEEKQRKEKENLSLLLLSSLSDEYATLYYVLAATGDYQVIKKDNEFGNKVSSRLSNGGNFYKDSEENIASVIYEEDAHKLKPFSSWENMEKAFGENDSFITDYRLVIDGAPVWYSVKAVKIYGPDKELRYAIGIKSIEEQLRQQRRLEESLTFTNFFLDTYMSAYYVNLDTLKWRVYKRPKALDAAYPTEDSYYDSISKYINCAVHPDDREELIAIVTPARMKEILRQNTEFSHSFRDNSTSEERIFKMQVIRGKAENQAAIGFVDITQELHEQQLRLLGAVPLSPDILTKANIGLWAFELDEGKAPRMYVDDTMLGLVGLAHQVSPEETYHAWYDHIDADSYGLVTDAVAKMMSGEHAEVQYPWHHPDGHTMIVRCGGVRNPEYKTGIRIEGTHQNVTTVLHFDEETLRRMKQQEIDLVKLQLRGDALKFISDNEPDLDKFIDFFGNRILEISKCDQVIFRDLNGNRIAINAPGIKDIPQSICSQCPFSDIENQVYSKNGLVIMNDCSKGYMGISSPHDCPAKSSFMQRITSGGKMVGMLAVHYLNSPHEFSEDGIEIMKTVATYFGILLERIEAKKTERARILAESSNKAKTEFLFNMSHDIRTPMNAILGYANIGLRHFENPEKSKETFTKIKNAGDHLLKLINDILEMSRIEAGKLNLINAPLNLRKTVEEINELSAILAASKDITFKTNLIDITDPYVYADDVHLNKVLINLISNAVKYTHEGGVISFAIRQLGKADKGLATYRFEVSDNGIGMSEEFQKHMFEAFSRESNTTISKQEGAGLGLSIVKNIVDMAGGSINLKSKLNEGTSFAIDVPLRLMDQAAIEEFERKNKPDAILKKTSTLRGKRILLVEDNEMNREIAAELLTEDGLAVDMAENGAVAVQTVSAKAPDYYDFILMDIQMPVMNGYEATAAIRALPGYDKVPIIALSANAFEEDRQKSLSVGMNAHIAKPIKVKTLFDTMLSLLNG